MEVGLSPGDFVLDADPAPSPKRVVPYPIFGPYMLWPTGWMDQDATWEVGLGPSDIVLDRDPAPPPKKGADKAPHFWPMSIVVKRLNGSSCHLARR